MGSKRTFGRLTSFFAFFSFILAILACGGGGGSGGGGVQHVFYVYVTNSGTNDISQFVPDATGLLTLVGRYPVGNGPVAIANDGHRLFVANQTDGTVTQYSLDYLGRPTLTNTYNVGGTPTSIDFRGVGATLPGNIFVTVAGSNKIICYSDDYVNALTELVRRNTGNTPAWVGHNFDSYVANLGDGNISHYGFSASGFGLRTQATVGVGSGPVRVCAGNHTLAVLNATDASVTSFLESVPTNGFGDPTIALTNTCNLGTTNPSAIQFVLASGTVGDGFYVANHGSNSITRLDLSAAGIVTKSTLADTPSGNLPNDLVVAGFVPAYTGQVLYEADDDAKVTGYVVGTNGSLLKLGAWPTGGSQSKNITVFTGGYQSYNEGTIDWVTKVLVNGEVGQAYDQKIETTGFFYASVIAGNLPNGLSLTYDSRGVNHLSGTPTQQGTFNFTLQATTGLHTIQRDFSVVVTPPGTPSTANVSFYTGMFDFPNNDPDIQIGPVDFGIVAQGSVHAYQLINVGSQSLGMYDNANHLVKSFTVNPTGDKRWIYTGVGSKSDGYDLISESFLAGTKPSAGTSWLTIFHGIKGLTETTDFYVIPAGMTIGNTPYKITGMTPLTSQTLILNIPSSTTFQIVATEPGQPTNIVAQSPNTIKINTLDSLLSVLVSPPSASAQFYVAAETIP